MRKCQIDHCPRSDDPLYGLKKYQNISLKMDNLSNKLLSGEYASFVLFLIIGFFIFMFLFSTVHRRDKNEIINKSRPRYSQLIRFWITKGYFRHGGLWIRSSGNLFSYSPPKENEQIKWAYRSSPMGYLQIAHLLERIHYLLRGNYSYVLMRIHNQALVWLSSALLGLLAMRLALSIQLNPSHALLLGISCQAIYQTFPVNLKYYWEVYPTTVLPVFVILFLLLAEKMFFQTKTSTKILILRGFCVFAMFYVDYSTAIFFLATYILFCAVLGFPVFKNQHILKTLILPASLALGLFIIQLMWVKIYFPDIQFVGGGFMFRTGFDGSVVYYKDHFDLLHKYRIFSWRYLFLAGSFSFLFLITIYHKLPQLKYPMFVLDVALGLYLPFAFMFSQATVIHPYGYDAYLVIPLLLSFFSVFPASVEKLTRNNGIFVFLFCILAFCYSMVQIRAYAIQFPING